MIDSQRLTYNLLKINKDDKFIQNDNEQIIEELFRYKTEFESQTNNLIEAILKIDYFRKKYDEIYNFTPVGHFTLDSFGGIIEANSAGAKLLEVQKDKLINQFFSQYISPDSRVNFVEYLKILLQDRICRTCEIQLLKNNGVILDVLIKAKLTEKSASGMYKILISVTDIAHLKEMEQQNRQLKPSH
jgi:PAS domain S-box-containing protein